MMLNLAGCNSQDTKLKPLISIAKNYPFFKYSATGIERTKDAGETVMGWFQWK